MKTIISILAFSALLFSGCTPVVVEQPVAEARVIPPSPGPTYVWVGDSWDYDHRTRVYAMREGQWVQPRRKTAVWVDGHWKKTRGGWKYVKGHWRYN